MASPVMKRVAFTFGLGSTVPLYFYLSDSQSTFYKYALKIGKVVTEGDAEFAHKAGVFLAKHSIVPHDKIGNDKILGVKLWGLNFPNPIGLAAGFDKNAECMQSMLSTGLGFGFVEVGSITPVPQPGNPLPRVFRLSKDLAIINRYGFNSDGIESVSKNLHSYRENQCKITERSPQGFVGVNLGKNKETKEALLDYLFGIKALTQYADYMVINVSSPNTPGLRLLQGRKELHYLLAGVKKELQEVVGKPDYLSKSNNSSEKYSPPLLVKISPDMSDSELADVAAISLELKIDGIIISNTTINERENLLEKDLSNETGGLSGKPLLNRSNEALSKMYLLTKGKIPLIGVGGITTADDVYLKMKLGASLVQLYTSLIYEGPGLPANLKEDLIKLVKQDGFSNIEEVIGIAHKKK